MEIGLAFFGTLALVRGKMTLTSSRVVVGTPARLLGLLALMQLPIVIAIGLWFAFMHNGPEKDNPLKLTLIEAGVVIGFAILVFGLGWILASSPKEAMRRERERRYDEDERYEYDDRPRRRDGNDRDDDEYGIEHKPQR